MKGEERNSRTTNGEILISCVHRGFIRNVFKVIKCAIKSSTWSALGLLLAIHSRGSQHEMDRFQLGHEAAEMAAVTLERTLGNSTAWQSSKGMVAVGG